MEKRSLKSESIDSPNDSLEWTKQSKCDENNKHVWFGNQELINFVICDFMNRQSVMTYLSREIRISVVILFIATMRS